jgi:uncharacterized membrane protein
MPLRILTTNTTPTRKCSPPRTMEYTILHWLFATIVLIYSIDWCLYADLGHHLSTGFSCCVCVCFFMTTYTSLVTIVTICSDLLALLGPTFFSRLPTFRCFSTTDLYLVTRSVPAYRVYNYFYSALFY